MSSTEDRPSLPFVSRADAREIEGDGINWCSAVNEKTADCAEFEFGTAKLEPGATSRITPEHQFDESSGEAVAMITAGRALVTIGGTRTELRPPDCFFVPAGGEYTFENAAPDPVEFLWGAADHGKQPLGDGEAVDHDGVPQVVRTICDVDANVTIEPGNTVRHWPAVFPETAGSAKLNLGLFRRPPGSAVRMHEHDPATITEAFTVLEGTLLVRDQDGADYVLEPGDFLYVPEHGMHNNKNIGTDDIVYACLETPARSREFSPMK